MVPSPNPVSRRIELLEDELGVRLFDRVRGRVAHRSSLAAFANTSSGRDRPLVITLESFALR